MKKSILMFAFVIACSFVAMAHGDEKGKKACCKKETAKTASLSATAPAASSTNAKDKKACCSKEGSAKKASLDAAKKSNTKKSAN